MMTLLGACRKTTENTTFIYFLCNARRSCELTSILFEKRIVCILHANWKKRNWLHFHVTMVFPFPNLAQKSDQTAVQFGLVTFYILFQWETFLPAAFVFYFSCWNCSYFLLKTTVLKSSEEKKDIKYHLDWKIQ